MSECSVAELLDGHVALDLQSLDRIYLNAYVPRLQVSGQVVHFLTRHLGQPIASPALFQSIGQRFRRAVARFAGEREIPVLRFPSKRWALLTAMAMCAVALVAACGNEEASPTATATATVQSETDQPAVGLVIAAIQARDQERLRDLVGDSVTDQERERLATCLPQGVSVELENAAVDVQGDTATANVRIRVTQDGQVSTTEQQWRYERDANGRWRLIEMPDCPFSN